MDVNVSMRTMRAFLMLVECKQFNHAAERCHLSDSAFSQMIFKLEAQLGVKLFERSTRNVSLTPEGELLVPTARRMIQDLDTVAADLLALSQGRSGKVSIAVLPSLADNWLPNVVSIFRKEFPDIEIRFFDVITAPGLDLVRRGIADFAINMRTEEAEDFDVQQLFTSRFYFVCQPSHAFANRRRISTAQLAGCEYIHSIKSGVIWPYLRGFLEKVPLREKGVEVTQLSTLAGLVVSGFGVSIVPGFAIEQFKYRGLKAIPVSDEGLHCPVLMVKRRKNPLSTAAHAMLNVMRRNPA